MDKGFLQVKCGTAIIYLAFIHCVAACHPEIAFLGHANRLEDPNLVDVFFFCKANGSFLVWGINNNSTGLNGFYGYELGKFVVGSREDFKYIATLLSSEKTGENLYQMESVLVLSFPSDRLELLKVVMCNTNLEISEYVYTHVSEGAFNSVINSSIKSTVGIDYVYSGLNNSIHILRCGTQFNELFVEIKEPGIEFTLNQSLTRKLFFSDNTTANVLSIVMPDERFYVTSLIILQHLDDVVVTCSSSMGNASITIGYETSKNTSLMTTSQYTLPKTVRTEEGSRLSYWKVILIIIGVAITLFGHFILQIIVIACISINYKRIVQRKKKKTTNLLPMHNKDIQSDVLTSTIQSRDNSLFPGKDNGSTNGYSKGGSASKSSERDNSNSNRIDSPDGEMGQVELFEHGSDIAKPLKAVGNSDSTRQRRTTVEEPLNEQQLTGQVRTFANGETITVDPPQKIHFPSKNEDVNDPGYRESGDEF